MRTLKARLRDVSWTAVLAAVLVLGALLAVLIWNLGTLAVVLVGSSITFAVLALRE